MANRFVTEIVDTDWLVICPEVISISPDPTSSSAADGTFLVAVREDELDEDIAVIASAAAVVAVVVVVVVVVNSVVVTKAAWLVDEVKSAVASTNSPDPSSSVDTVEVLIEVASISQVQSVHSARSQ